MQGSRATRQPARGRQLAPRWAAVLVVPLVVLLGLALTPTAGATEPEGVDATGAARLDAAMASAEFSPTSTGSATTASAARVHAIHDAIAAHLRGATTSSDVPVVGFDTPSGGDPAGDSPPAGDILEYGSDYSRDTIILAVLTRTWNPSWASQMGVGWYLDVNGDNDPDYYGAFPNSSIYRYSDESVLCDTEYAAANESGNGFYGLRFPASCIGAPGSFRLAASVFYSLDDFDTYYEDDAPDRGFGIIVNRPPPPPPPPDVTVGPAVGTNADGRLEVFMLGPDSTLVHSWQVAPNSGWSPFVGFGPKGVGTPAVARNRDGRMEVFVVSTDGRVSHAWQLAPNSAWSPFVPLGPAILPNGSGLAAHPNADGRLEVFGLGFNGDMVHAWQLHPGSVWSPMVSLGTGWAGSPTVAPNTDGRLELFAIGANGYLHHSWQIAPNAAWSGWATLGGPFHTANNPAAVLGPSGRLEVFALDQGQYLIHAWQLAAGSVWSGFAGFGEETWRGSPAAARNADGRLEVFVEGADRGLAHSWQAAPNSGTWSPWVGFGGQSL